MDEFNYGYEKIPALLIKLHYSVYDKTRSLKAILLLDAGFWGKSPYQFLIPLLRKRLLEEKKSPLIFLVSDEKSTREALVKIYRACHPPGPKLQPNNPISPGVIHPVKNPQPFKPNNPRVVKNDTAAPEILGVFTLPTYLKS